MLVLAGSAYPLLTPPRQVLLVVVVVGLAFALIMQLSQLGDDPSQLDEQGHHHLQDHLITVPTCSACSPLSRAASPSARSCASWRFATASSFRSSAASPPAVRRRRTPPPASRHHWRDPGAAPGDPRDSAGTQDRKSVTVIMRPTQHTRSRRVDRVYQVAVIVNDSIYSWRRLGLSPT